MITSEHISSTNSTKVFKNYNFADSSSQYKLSLSIQQLVDLVRHRQEEQGGDANEVPISNLPICTTRFANNEITNAVTKLQTNAATKRFMIKQKRTEIMKHIFTKKKIELDCKK